MPGRAASCACWRSGDDSIALMVMVSRALWLLMSLCLLRAAA